MQEPSEIQLNPLHETSEVFQTGERLTIATALKRFASCWNAGLAWVAFRLNVQLRKELRNLPLRTFLPLRSLHPFWGGCTCQPNPGAANTHYLFWSLQVSHFQYSTSTENMDIFQTSSTSSTMNHHQTANIIHIKHVPSLQRPEFLNRLCTKAPKHGPVTISWKGHASAFQAQMKQKQPRKRQYFVTLYNVYFLWTI